jgi:hypothetical protein
MNCLLETLTRALPAKHITGGSDAAPGGPWRAGDGDVTSRLLHGAVESGEPDPLADPLGGVERLEQVLPRLRIDALSGVLDGEHNVGTRLQAPGPRILRSQLDVGGADGEPAAARHGLSGVCRKIGDRLLDVLLVRDDQCRALGQIGAELDAGEGVGVQRFADHLLDDAVQVQTLGFPIAVAAEGEQPAGQLRRAVRRDRNLLRVGRQRVRRGQLAA